MPENNSILAPNSTAFERGLEEAFSTWPLINRPGGNLLTEIFSTLWDPDKIHEELLPYLAFGLGVSIWPDAWGTEKKREFVRRYLKIRYKQGTKWSVEQAAEALGIKLTIENPPTPYVSRYTVDTTGGVNIPTRELLKMVRDILEAFTPVSERFILQTAFLMEAKVAVDSRLIITKIKRLSMASNPKIVITTAGQKAISAAIASGRKLSLKEFGFGKSLYEPSENQTSMKSVEERFPVADLRERDQGEAFHITCLANSEKAYDVGEIGIFDDMGILFAIVSRPESPITVKIDFEDLIIACDISMKNSEAKFVTNANAGSTLNLSLAPELSEFSRILTEINATVRELSERVKKLEGQP